MAKLKVFYEPDDIMIDTVSDGHAEKYVLDIVKDCVNSEYEYELHTSQEMIIDWVRIAILRDLISHQDVEFLYKDFVICPDRFGHLINWPSGFCDYRDKILDEILRGMINKFEKG